MRFFGGNYARFSFFMRFFFNYAHLYAYFLSIYARFMRFSGGLLITISPHEEHLLAWGHDSMLELLNFGNIFNFYSTFKYRDCAVELLYVLSFFDQTRNGHSQFNPLRLRMDGALFQHLASDPMRHLMRFLYSFCAIYAFYAFPWWKYAFRKKAYLCAKSRNYANPYARIKKGQRPTKRGPVSGLQNIVPNLYRPGSLTADYVLTITS